VPGFSGELVRIAMRFCTSFSRGSPPLLLPSLSLSDSDLQKQTAEASSTHALDFGTHQYHTRPVDRAPKEERACCGA
jgi:hypothetical protein